MPFIITVWKSSVSSRNEQLTPCVRPSVGGLGLSKRALRDKWPPFRKTFAVGVANATGLLTGSGFGVERQRVFRPAGSRLVDEALAPRFTALSRYWRQPDDTA